MKRTVTTIIAVSIIALSSGSVMADNWHANQDQSEDLMYGSGVTASAGEPYRYVDDDRDHDNYLLFNVDQSDQPSRFVSYVRIDDDRDHNGDQLHGPGDRDQTTGFSPYVASH